MTINITWDGSFLGSYDTSIIQKRFKKDNKTHFILKTEDFEIKCLAVAPTKNLNLYCILDEIKPVFGIKKTGTHRIQIKNKIYLIYKSESKFTDDIKLKEFSKNTNKINTQKFKNDMSKLILYIDIIGLNRLTESNVFVRSKSDDCYYPIIYNNSVNKLSDNYNTFTDISKFMLKKWIDTNIINDTVKLMVNFKKSDDITLAMFSISKQIEQIISTIDNAYIWLSNLICSKLQKYIIS